MVRVPLRHQLEHLGGAPLHLPQMKEHLRKMLRALRQLDLQPPQTDVGAPAPKTPSITNVCAARK